MPDLSPAPPVRTPRLQGCGFFCPAPGVSQIDGYFQLYNVTSHAIAAVDPLLAVGGPATAYLDWVTDFMDRTDSGRAMPAHFVSTHSYPTDYTNPASQTRTMWEDGILFRASQTGNLPLVMTEISAGLGTQYDPPFAGSFVLHATAAFLGVANVPTLSYWTFSDVFEEQGFQSAPWVNEYGIQVRRDVTARGRRSRDASRAR